MGWRDFEKVPSSLPMPELFLKELSPGAVVLDVGCGEAGVAHDVAARGARYVGVDVNLPSLRRAARIAPVVLGEGGALPFASGCADLVMLRAVLTVLPGPEHSLPVLREALRVCRRAVAVQDFLQTPELPLYAARYRQGREMGREQGTFPVLEGETLLYWARHHTVEELADLARQAGGRLVAVERHPAPTRSGNVINGVRLLLHPHKHL